MRLKVSMTFVSFSRCRGLSILVQFAIKSESYISAIHLLRPPDPFTPPLAADASHLLPPSFTAKTAAKFTLIWLPFSSDHHSGSGILLLVIIHIMEENPHKPREANDISDYPDLEENHGAEAADSYGEQFPFQESSTPKPPEVQPVSSLIDELESRLTVGQVMKSVEDAYLLYCNYAHAKGFSVKKGDQRYFPCSSELQAKDFECSCEGVKQERHSNDRILVSQNSIRTKCKARFKVGREKGGEWRVTRFMMEHNHEMFAADQIHLLRSSRNISHAQKSTLEAMVNARISIANAVSYMEEEAHGPQNSNFVRKYAYDYLSRLRKHTTIENGDASELVKHFINKSNKEPFFYWDVQLDDDYRVMNFFFRDYRGRIDYESFGDVLSIDTTYRTNRYNLICTPFVGINHHRQNVMFCLAFMSDETEGSFEWLFRTFRESMNGKQPETIFSNQCQAMMNVIERIFPCAYHRLCQWHINQNTPSYLGNLNCDSRFEQFGHNWLNGMYKLRRKCATAFSNHKFTAGDLGTWKPPMIVKNNPLLNHAADVYTINMYNLFELELVESLSTEFTEQPSFVGPFLTPFKVKSHDQNSKVRKMVFDEQKNEIKCSCYRFESMGILCKHALKVLNLVKVHSIPEHYIKKRWTKNARNRVLDEGSGSGHVSEIEFVNQSMRLFYDLAMWCKTYEETRNMLTEFLNGATGKANDWFEHLSLNDLNACDDLISDERNDLSNEMLLRKSKKKNRKGKG
ncbi:hypothetical protein Pfo_015946 [Paulownia fortunei]|nr:hypothetical protein Pfo_015946 [Paulownia fortunei]